MTVHTKEGATVAWPADDATEPEPEMTPRDLLAAEWQERNPTTAEQITAFYQESAQLRGDLDAWHQAPSRQLVTDMLIHVARQAGVQHVVDIGCGAGHDLLALQDAIPDLHLFGVEPNRDLRVAAHAHGLSMWPSANHLCPIETADMLICIDVLEHVVDPETFLADIAQRAPIGCLLFEMTATFDTTTPLHLKDNRGWHPGRVLERHGWEMVDFSGDNARVRIWRRTEETGRQRASLLLCTWRNVTVDALESIMAVTQGRLGWRLKIKTGDSLISRSRSILVTDWWRSTNDDVFLMIDDDVTYAQADADHVVELCRNGMDIVGGAYPVRNGGHFACRTLPDTGYLSFGPGQEVVEVLYAATGFMAVHRRVIDALIPTLPLCHAGEPWSFYPLFQSMILPTADGHESLSEDWGFSHMARALGFTVWLDQSVVLRHEGMVPISARNMAAIHAAIEQA